MIAHSHGQFDSSGFQGSDNLFQPDIFRNLSLKIGEVSECDNVAGKRVHRKNVGYRTAKARFLISVRIAMQV